VLVLRDMLAIQCVKCSAVFVGCNLDTHGLTLLKLVLWLPETTAVLMVSRHS